MTKVLNLILFGVISFIISSCQWGSREADISGFDSDITIHRFELDLVNHLKDSMNADLSPLRSKYGDFFEMFTHQVLAIPEEDDTLISMNLRYFIKDAEIAEVYEVSDSVFNDVSDIKKGMDSFFKYHQYYFPEQPLPKVATYISAFNYAVITTGDFIGIGLDMFLGSDSEYYPRLGVPKYMSERFRREYIVASVIRGWFESEFDSREVKKEFLSQMIYQGKLLFYLDAMAPNMADTVKTGYSSSQLEWCNENESSIWAFFIENKLLFNTNPSEYAKYINEGPATGGFPAESPGKIGAWIGHRIVKEYMDKNSEFDLHDLLKENDAQTILEKSGYKPKR